MIEESKKTKLTKKRENWKRREKNKKMKPKMRGLHSKISKAQRHQLEFQKQESICLNFIRAINEILKPEGYDIEFRKRKGTKLITTHTNKENICIHIHTQIISKLKYSSSTSSDWCVIQSQTILVSCWPNEKVRVKPAPIEDIDRRAMFRSRDFRPMREEKTDGVPVNEFLHWPMGSTCNALSHGRARCYPYRCMRGLECNVEGV